MKIEYKTCKIPFSDGSENYNEGDKVLSLVIGNFSQRLAKIAKGLGADVETIEVVAVGYNGVVDGNEHTITVTVINPVSGYTIRC